MSDIDTNETDEQADPAADTYVVDPNYRPKASAQVGSQRTDSQGAFNVRTVSPIFAQADQRSALLAKHALDPRDPTPASHVTFPEAAVPDHETVTQRLRDLAHRVEERFHPTPQDYLAGSADRSPSAMSRARDEAEAAQAPAEDAQAPQEALESTEPPVPAGEASGSPEGEPQPTDEQGNPIPTPVASPDPSVEYPATVSAEGAPDGVPASPLA